MRFSEQQQLLLFAVAPSLEQPPGLSEYIILSLGVFLGNIAMGICGFGTAIIHLTVWVSAQALGYNAGPLPKAVITCSCAMTIGMVPLFFLAEARRHAIRPLAISIPLFKALAAPFGALILKLLPARNLETIVAVLMMLMIILINKHKLRTAARRFQQYCCPGEVAAELQLECPACPSKHVELTADAENDERDTLLVVDVRQPIDDTDSPDWQLQQTGPITPHYSYNSDQHICSSSCSDDSDSSEDNDDVEQPLIDAQPQSDQRSTIEVHDPQQGALASDGVQPVGHMHVVSQLAIQAPLGYQDGPGFWPLFVMGSVTGLCTGTLGGATGISGPPLMILYAFLNTSKDAVRGTNAVMSLVQDQWIGYYVFGLLQRVDLYLYLSAAVAGALGMLIGHSVQKLMDQRHFNAVMSVLMGVCCVLMCSAAAGWINLAEP